MKRLTLALLFLAPAIAVIPAAIADPIVLGPLTFGSGAPIASDSGFYPPNFVQVLLTAPTTFSAGSTPASEVATFVFSFDIAPGWAISDMALLIDGIQPESADWISNPPVWGYQLDEELTLCSSSDVCSSAQVTKQNGPNAGQGTVPLGALVGPGSGVLQIELSAVEDSFFLVDGPGDNDAFISVEPISPTPEPSSWLLMGTGLLGIAFMASRKKPAARSSTTI